MRTASPSDRDRLDTQVVHIATLCCTRISHSRPWHIDCLVQHPLVQFLVPRVASVPHNTVGFITPYHTIPYMEFVQKYRVLCLMQSCVCSPCRQSNMHNCSRTTQHTPNSWLRQACANALIKPIICEGVESEFNVFLSFMYCYIVMHLI